MEVCQGNRDVDNVRIIQTALYEYDLVDSDNLTS